MHNLIFSGTHEEVTEEEERLCFSDDEGQEDEREPVGGEQQVVKDNVEGEQFVKDNVEGEQFVKDNVEGEQVVKKQVEGERTVKEQVEGERTVKEQVEGGDAEKGGPQVSFYRISIVILQG